MSRARGTPAPSDLDEIVILSSTVHRHDTAARAAAAERLAALAGEPGRFVERVLIRTCHRAELVAVLADGADAAPVADTELSRGAAAVERLLHVVAGLDSVVLAEEQLIGQVREAYTAALARGETGPILNELFRSALGFGRRVRAAALPGGDGSLAARAVGLALERRGSALGAAAGAGAAAGPGAAAGALVVGTGETARQLATGLAAAGLRCTVASRSLERAAAVVAALPRPDEHRTARLPEALDAAGDFEIVAIATRTAAPILTAAHLNGGAPLILDLSAPAAVDPALRERPGLELIDLDGLAPVARPSPLRPADEARLRAALRDERDRLVDRLRARGSGEGIALLRREAAGLRERHLRRLRRRAALSEDQAAAVEAAMDALVADLLHVPILRLRRDPEAADRVRELFGLGR